MIQIEEIKSEISRTHGDLYKYPYIDSELEDRESIITIICEKHHILVRDSVNRHLKYASCPMCMRYNLFSLNKNYFNREKK